MDNKILKVTPIKHGTVIDHIPAGMAFHLVKVLSLESQKSPVSILLRVPSKVLGFKDIIKIEDRELDVKEINKIAIIAPLATINIIRNEKVFQKKKVSLPAELAGIIKCQNPNCISNKKDEKVQSRVIVEQQNPLRVRCHYCERIVLNPQDAIEV